MTIALTPTTVAVDALRAATATIDQLGPATDERLWAARCAIDAAVLLLGAYRDPDHEALLEAVAAARAAAVAATSAALRATDHEEDTR